MDLVRQELSGFTERWNCHLLAPCKGAIFPRERPVWLYHLPELFGSASWLIPVSSEEKAEFEDLLFATDVLDVSPEFQEFTDIVFEGQGNFSDRSANIIEALGMYFPLVEAIAFYGWVDLMRWHNALFSQKNQTEILLTEIKLSWFVIL